MTALIVFTDGRDHIFDQARRESWQPLADECSERWIFDDSADHSFGDRLRFEYVADWRIVSWPQRLGFGGTIARAWQVLRLQSRAEYIAHIEDDFVLAQPVALGQLVGILDRNPHLVQIALLRQAVNEAEVAAGGIVAENPGAFTECADDRACWLEHREFFTTNPCLYRASLLGHGWPQVPRSEEAFTGDLLTRGSPEVGPEDVRFGFLGARDWPPMVEHVGHVRKGTNY